VVLAATEKDDGYLTARELCRLPLRADVVVLSSCDTSRSRASRGVGLSALSWSFITTNVPTQVFAAWPMTAAISAPLMKDFYTRLNAGDSPAAALCAAQNKAIQDPQRHHPAYWASFFVME
jgi:CHAT domain-containing protein